MSFQVEVSGTVKDKMSSDLPGSLCIDVIDYILQRLGNESAVSLGVEHNYEGPTGSFWTFNRIDNDGEVWRVRLFFSERDGVRRIWDAWFRKLNFYECEIKKALPPSVFPPQSGIQQVD